VSDADVVLADVDAIGVGICGQLRRIVHDKRHAELSTDRRHDPSCGELFLGTELFFSKLDDVDAASEDGR
jgi:hypothetical protein